MTTTWPRQSSISMQHYCRIPIFCDVISTKNCNSTKKEKNEEEEEEEEEEMDVHITTMTQMKIPCSIQHLHR